MKVSKGIAVLAVATLTSTSARASTFRYLSDVYPVPGLQSRAYAISADGSQIAGSMKLFGELAGVYDLADNAFTDLGFDRSNSCAYGITANGRYATGYASYDPIAQAVGPFRWSVPRGEILPLPRVAGSYTSEGAYDVSDDGNTVVGSVEGHAAIWNVSTGERITIPSQYAGVASSVSADGSRAVGYRFNAASELEGFVWTRQTGATALPGVTGKSYVMPCGVSDNGLTIVGYCGDNYNSGVLVRWQIDPLTGAASTQAIGGNGNVMVLGYPQYRSCAISPDGTTVAGTIGGEPCLWSEETGIVPLAQFFPPSDPTEEAPPGSSSGGGDVAFITGIAGDNKTIVGNSILSIGGSDATNQAWVLSIPEPTLATWVFAVVGLNLKSRRARMRQNPCDGYKQPA